jgi:hypothetical protein
MSIQVIDALKEMRPFFVEEPVLPKASARSCASRGR